MDAFIKADYALAIYILPEEFDETTDEINETMRIGQLHSIDPETRTGVLDNNGSVTYTIHTNTSACLSAVGRPTFASYFKEKKIIPVFMSNSTMEGFGFIVATNRTSESPTQFETMYINDVLLFDAKEKAKAEAAVARTQGRRIPTPAAAVTPTETTGTTATTGTTNKNAKVDPKEDRRRSLKLEPRKSLNKLAFNLGISAATSLELPDLIDAIVDYEFSRKKTPLS